MAPKKKTAADRGQAGAGRNGAAKEPSASGMSPVKIAAVVVGPLVGLAGFAWTQHLQPRPPGRPSSRAEPAASPLISLPPLWAEANSPLASRLQANLSCAPPTAESGQAGGACSTTRCARFVEDDVVPLEEATELRNLMQWLVDEAWGAGAGAPSVVDLHDGSISYKDKFVDLYELMKFKQVKFSPAQVDAYGVVRSSLRRHLARIYGVPEESLLHDMTFFSHINASKAAKTLHDEYWHQHIDMEQYQTFAYTALLYLSTEGEDFDGGEFIFEETTANDSSTVAVEPRLGRLVTFTSDSENPHRVEKVRRGVRMTLTAGFTCNAARAEAITPFPRPPAVAESETEGSSA